MDHKKSNIILEEYENKFSYKKSKTNLNIEFNRIAFIFFIFLVISIIFSIQLLHLGSLKQDKKVTIQGDGSNVRAFLHVKDVASALDVILHKGVVGEIYNIGSDDHDEYTVDGIAKKLIHMVHNTTDYEQYVEYIADRPFNDKRYYISNAKVKDLGWNITVSFEKGLQELIEES